MKTCTLLALSALWLLAACETVSGFGRDVENSGHHIEQNAKDSD